MQPQDDDFPYASDDPSLAPLEGTESSEIFSTQQANNLKALLRVALGSAMNGTDLLIARARRMQELQKPLKQGDITIDENETTQDHLRYLLLGILFEIPDVLQRGLSSTGKASSKVYDLVNRIFTPFTNSWLFSPVKGQYEQAAARGEKVIDRLIMKGRLEEQNSRQILQEKAINDLINEFVEYLVVKIKVQEIIEQQGASMAGDVMGDFQSESSNVDEMLEKKLKSIFRKNPPTPPSSSPEIPAEGSKS